MLKGSAIGCCVGSFEPVDVAAPGVGWEEPVVLGSSNDGIVGVFSSAISFSDFNLSGGSRDRPSAKSYL